MRKKNYEWKIDKAFAIAMAKCSYFKETNIYK